jgi:hypothetical protein|tara:strand:- start:140 stop:355 length:216 start_codon:yes stop_codon:yes gene_type:complete
MAFKENIEFNSLTPEDVFIVSIEVKNLLNKILNGGLSSVAFVRENEEGNIEIKPATHRDKKLLLEIFNSNK